MSFWRSQEVKSKKERRCEFCGKKINIGENYSRQAGVYEGEFYTYPLCMFCETALPILGEYHEDGFEPGTMMDDLINQGFLSCPSCKRIDFDYKRSEPAKNRFMCSCDEYNHIWIVELTTDIFTNKEEEESDGRL